MHKTLQEYKKVSLPKTIQEIPDALDQARKLLQILKDYFSANKELIEDDNIIALKIKGNIKDIVTKSGNLLKFSASALTHARNQLAGQTKTNRKNVKKEQ